MKVRIKLELIIGETTVQRTIIPLNIQFENFKMVKK
jgi:hypothetical protein